MTGIVEQLLDAVQNVDLDPVASPLGIAVIILGVLVALKAIKTVIKLAMIAIIGVGVYLFLYGGNLGSGGV